MRPSRNAKGSRAQREAEGRRQQAANDWPAFWETLDKRIAAIIAAQYTFTKDQQELLFDILKDARVATSEGISKAIDEARRAEDARFEALERRVKDPAAIVAQPTRG